ncbi:MAG: T9SS type A sorting domain-containing protein [Saprospiraceae bacterium]|nr:T9SS type A sorting domain-containing protein [Saprospiraceae bacterium]
MFRAVGVLFISCLLSSAVAQVRSDIGKQSIQEISTLTLAPVDRSARFAQEIVSYPSNNDDCSISVGVTPLASIMAWGFIEGTNQFGDLEKAQRLTFTGSAEYEVIAVIGYFATPSIVGNGMIKAIIYEEDPDSGEPGDSIGESVALAVNMVAVPDSFINATLFQFLQSSSAKPSSENFFVSIDISQLYQSEDTLALFSTTFGCGAGTDTYDRIPGGAWFAVGDSLNSWNVSLDYLLEAIVEFDDPTNTDAYIANGGLQLHPAYPNPSQQEVFINFSLEGASEVTIDVFDLMGKRVDARDLSRKEVGRHQASIQTVQLLPGQYYYRISTDHGHLGSRFTVE